MYWHAQFLCQTGINGLSAEWFVEKLNIFNHSKLYQVIVSAEK
jgi:hypothetical protein